MLQSLSTVAFDGAKVCDLAEKGETVFIKYVPTDIGIYTVKLALQKQLTEEKQDEIEVQNQCTFSGNEITDLEDLFQC